MAGLEIANRLEHADIRPFPLRRRSVFFQHGAHLIPQLAQFRRTPKVLVAARIDREVYDWLLQYGKGYSTRINSILRTVMDRTR